VSGTLAGFLQDGDVGVGVFPECGPPETSELGRNCWRLAQFVGRCSQKE
jgi:hypothetical protein